MTILLMIQLHLFSQPFYFRNYQVENGLSNNAVLCSLQDSLGFMWFGTKDGLNRFDGYSFKVFRSDAKNNGSIGNNFILSLYEDPSGILWVGTGKGLYRYNRLTEDFTLIQQTATRAIEEIASDKKGDLWMVSDGALFILPVQQDTLIHKNRHGRFGASSICADTAGTIWVATSQGILKKYDGVAGSFTDFDLFAHSKPPSAKWIERICATDNGYLMIGTTAAGGKIFDTRRLDYTDIHPGGKYGELFVRNFVQTGAREFWMGTESGIFICNMDSGNCINLVKKYGDPYTISDNAIYTFSRDKEGGIWVGSYFGGVNYYPGQFTPFDKEYPGKSDYSLNGNVVREIKKDPYGNLWIGTEDAGLNKWEKSTGRFRHFLPDGSKGSISYLNIHGLLVNGDELWVGTFEHGLDILDLETEKVVRHYAAPGNGLRSNFIYCLYQSREKEIYVGTTIGAYVYNPTKDSFALIPKMPLHNWYTSILKDNTGTIWAATFGNGVNYYNPVTGENGNFAYKAADSSSLSSNRITSIFEDSRHNLWFTTEEGLCKFDRSKKTFKRYNTAQGFPSNFILSMLEDERGCFWISTTKGLVCYDAAKEKMQVYTTSNGLLSDQFNFNSAYHDADGKMYFGSASGLISFSPAAFRDNTFVPPVYITGFQVNYQDLTISKGSPLAQSIIHTNKITLTNDQSTFSIDFAALSHTAPQMIEYAYQLEGLSDEWIYLKRNRKVYFTDLAPGTYTFKVKASNNSGVWGEQETRLSIIVLPPWWATNWAWLVYGVTILGVVMLLVHGYHKRVEEKNRKKVELMELANETELFKAKIEFFTNIAHEIRTPLTLIKIPLNKVIRKTNQSPDIQNSLQIISNNTNRLIELSNQLLDFRQTEISGFNLSFVKVNINETVQEAYTSFASLAEERNILFEISLPNNAVEAFIDGEAFKKIIYNLLSNAVKYAARVAFIELINPRELSPTFTIRVKNDGFIIPPDLREKIFEPFYRIKENNAENGTGIGLALARSLTELHKGILQLEETDNKMNIFSLTLPLNQEVNGKKLITSSINI